MLSLMYVNKTVLYDIYCSFLIYTTLHPKGCYDTVEVGEEEIATMNTFKYLYVGSNFAAE